jgi:hypothetical protein
MIGRHRQRFIAIVTAMLLNIPAIGSSQGGSDSASVRYVRATIADNDFFIIKAGDARHIPSDEKIESDFLLARPSATVCYLTSCQTYGITSVRMKDGNDTIALQRPMSVFKMPCSIQCVAFPYDSAKTQELFLYNKKGKLVSVLRLENFRDELRRLPFFWTAKKPVILDWDGLPDYIMSKKCMKCK